jgi:hypothetical protein
MVALHQLVAVLTDLGLPCELLRREIRKMPHRKRQIQKEWLVRGHLPLHEVDGLGDKFVVDFGTHLTCEWLYGVQWSVRYGLYDMRPLCEECLRRLFH